jgi:hypothetical protein
MMNHIESHWSDFKSDGTTKDDNLAAIGWGIAGLMEVEKLYPFVLNDIIFRKKVISKQVSQQQFEEIILGNRSPFIL